MKKHLSGAAKFAVVLGVAVLIGVAVAIASALLGHEVLVLLYGDDLSVIDDTLPMIAAVWTSYLAGIMAGLVVLVVGWRRFVHGARRGAALASLAALAFAVSGCTSVSNLVNPPKPVNVQLEVWNRTLDPIFVVNQTGQRLDVPACGHAIAAQFQVKQVEVRTEQGFYFGSGTSGAGDVGRPQSMVITSTPGDSRAAADLANLPPCEGHPEVQPGVTFRTAD